jgi:hypothetical protein
MWYELLRPGLIFHHDSLKNKLMKWFPPKRDDLNQKIINT